MKKQSSINIKLAMAFGIIIVLAIGTIGSSSSALAQTNTSAGTTGNTTGTTTGNATTNGNQSDVTTTTEIENLTGDDTGGGSDIGAPDTGFMQGLEKEQTSGTGGNMTAADKTAGQNATNATTTGGGGGANATTANETSSQNNTGNPLSDVPIIGELFK
jgi:hypothetical protein